MTTSSDASQAVLPSDLTDEQWYDIAQANALRDWNADGFFESVKAVGRAAIAQDRSARAQAEPVAWTARGKDGLPKFGAGWIFSKVQNDTANMPLYDHPVARAQAEPVAWIVYLPSMQTQEIFDSQDDAGYVDWLTNYPDAVVTPLYAAAQAQGAGEAVGWQVKQKTYLNRGPWVDVDRTTYEAAARYPDRCEVRMLYAGLAIPQAAEVPGAIGFSPMWLAPIDGTPVLLYLPTTGAKFAVGQFHSEGPDTAYGFWGDDEGARYVHEPAGWMGLHVLERLAAAPTPTASAPKAEPKTGVDHE